MANVPVERGGTLLEVDGVPTENEDCCCSAYVCDCACDDICSFDVQVSGTTSCNCDVCNVNGCPPCEGSVLGTCMWEMNTTCVDDEWLVNINNGAATASSDYCGSSMTFAAIADENGCIQPGEYEAVIECLENDCFWGDNSCDQDPGSTPTPCICECAGETATITLDHVPADDPRCCGFFFDCWPGCPGCPECLGCANCCRTDIADSYDVSFHVVLRDSVTTSVVCETDVNVTINSSGACEFESNTVPLCCSDIKVVLGGGGAGGCDWQLTFIVNGVDVAPAYAQGANPISEENPDDATWTPFDGSSNDACLSEEILEVSISAISVT